MAAKNQIATTKQAQGFDQVMDRAKIFWAGLRPQQQVYLGIGLAITLAAVAFFVKMIATPDYKPLMKGLEPADAQAITTQLAAKKIPYQISPDGTSINVPADQVDAARLEVASHDTPHSGRIGFEIFDKVSWGQTEFDEKVNYQRALEGELERTIQTISNVKSARGALGDGHRIGICGPRARSKGVGHSAPSARKPVERRTVGYFTTGLRGG